jgi:ribosomal protein L28
MKYRLETAKPNISRRNLYSETLNKNLKLWISMKARKCIMKAGSLDNYLLNTHPRYLDSKYGLYLKDIIKKKQLDPEYDPGFILGTATHVKTKKTKVW